MPHGIRRSVFSRCATDAPTTAMMRLRPLATWPQWPDPAGQACTAAALPADPMLIAYRTHVDVLCAMLNELLGYNHARPVRPNICCRHSTAVVRTALWTARGACAACIPPPAAQPASAALPPMQHCRRMQRCRQMQRCRRVQRCCSEISRFNW